MELTPQACRSKADWRRWLLQARQTLSPDERRRAERQIADILSAQAVLRAWSQVAVFLPWRGEPDLVVVWRAWHQRGVGLSLPVVIAAEAPLQFRSWVPGQALVRDAQGLFTPDGQGQMECDVWIVPCVGVDRQGARLGAGKGYYDRTLAERRASGRPDPMMVGVLFKHAAVDADFGEPQDLRLHAWVHEGGWCQAEAPAPLSPSL
ncbi:MAG: 5-formyltetrahydrofolate cyclo-ligase [Burkholderiaceae bacterium]